jgi:hypothetical protein
VAHPAGNDSLPQVRRLAQPPAGREIELEAPPGDEAVLAVDLARREAPRLQRSLVCITLLLLQRGNPLVEIEALTVLKKYVDTAMNKLTEFYGRSLRK